MPPDGSATPSSRQNGPLPFLQLARDGEDFERFCTDLLNQQPRLWIEESGVAVYRRILSAERLAGGSDQRGADIRAQVEGGQVWMVQCKRVESFGPADVQAVVARMEIGFPNADRYVLAVTKALGHSAREKLGPKWLIWDADRLTLMPCQLESKPDAMTLVRKYFGESEVRRLLPWTLGLRLPWEHYFQRELEKDAAVHHRLPFIAMGDCLEHLVNFARTGAGRARVLVGHGGQGKSRLLLELARKLGEGPLESRIQVQFIGRHADPLGEYDVESLIQETSPTLLILEDAHQRMSLLRQLALAAVRSTQLRLLVTTRPSASESVRSALFQGGYEERIDADLVLPKWKRTQIEELAIAALGSPHSMHLPRLLELAQRSPLLVVIGATVVLAGFQPDQMTTREAFKEHVLRGLSEGFLSHQPEHRRDGLRKVTQVLAFIGPVQNDESLPNRLAKLLGRPELEIADDIDALQAAGLTDENNEGIRLYPDLFSDAVLRQAAVDGAGRPSGWGVTLARQLNLSDFPSIIRNLSIADWEVSQEKGDAPTHSLMEPVWSDLQERFAKGGWQERQGLLKAWIPTASFQPDRSLQLARLAMTAEDAPPDPKDRVISFGDLSDLGPRPVEKSRAEIHTLAGLVLEPVVVWHLKQAPEALDLLWELAGRLPTTGSNAHQHPIAVIARAAAFGVRTPLEASVSVLAWLEKRVGENAGAEDRLLAGGTFSALLKPFFGRSIEQDWQTGSTIHTQRILVDPDRVAPLRKRALALVQRWLTSGLEARIHAALPCLKIAISRHHDLSGLPDESPAVREWRGQRIDALHILSEVLPSLTRHPFALLEVISLLRLEEMQKGDEEFASTCRNLRGQIRDSFKLRLAKAISWDPIEEAVLDDRALDWEARSQVRHQRRAAFLSAVAAECVERWPSASQLCEELGKIVRQAKALERSIHLSELGHVLSTGSPRWARDLLETLLAAPADSLDEMLTAVFTQARETAAESYDAILARLALDGSAARLAGWIRSHSLRKSKHEPLRPAELDALRLSTHRSEDAVVAVLADLAMRWSNRDPQLAGEIFRDLKPASPAAAEHLLLAFRALLEHGESPHHSEWVGAGLTTLTRAGLEWLSTNSHHSGAILQKTPLAAYRNLVAQVDAGEGPDLGRLAWCPLSLGPIADKALLDQEITRHWAEIDGESRTRAARIQLLRALIDADAPGSPGRHRALIQNASTEDELLRALEVAFPRNSQSVLASPELVALAIACGERLGNSQEVSSHLFRSIYFGSRSGGNGVMDAQYASIVDRANDLARRHEDQPALSKLYLGIAQAEAAQQANFRRNYVESMKQMD
jgi:hypothetical protein